MNFYEAPEGLFSLYYPDGFNEPRAIGKVLGEETYIITTPDKKGSVVIGIGLDDESPSDDVWSESVSRPDLARTIGQSILLDQWDEYSRDIDSEARTVRIEVGSEEAGMHGNMWLEESEGIMMVIVWAAPDDQADQYQPQIDTLIRTFAWEPATVRAVLARQE
ncbi:MAG: hypothetical protein KDD73_05565 [Anaerolineales bacterium]|nr:hypothetical protein [Anaerolineales bacterium]MCB9126397.1 hypothetical protein [Ardenticatenales bacterium]MCB9171558.1 hypothetical protein [Ardenticatenales bacterium]